MVMVSFSSTVVASTQELQGQFLELRTESRRSWEARVGFEQHTRSILSRGDPWTPPTDLVCGRYYLRTPRTDAPGNSEMFGTFTFSKSRVGMGQNLEPWSAPRRPQLSKPPPSKASGSEDILKIKDSSCSFSGVNWVLTHSNVHECLPAAQPNCFWITCLWEEMAARVRAENQANVRKRPGQSLVRLLWKLEIGHRTKSSG